MPADDPAVIESSRFPLQSPNFAFREILIRSSQMGRCYFKLTSLRFDLNFFCQPATVKARKI